MKAITGLVARAGWRLDLNVVRALFCGPTVLAGKGHLLTRGDTAAFLSASTSGGGMFADSEILIVCDAHLINKDELCRQLDLPLFCNTAQLIAAAYRRWREHCAARLQGEFSFAIWDERAGLLFSARDRFGVRPFNYRITKQGILFGSLAACAACDVGLHALEINQGWLVDQLNGIVASKDQTAYADISRLPPAHSLTWSPHGDLTVRPYWSVDEIGPVSDTLDVDELQNALQEAVRSRTPSTAATAFLSGGLDSSTICCLAASQLRLENRPLLNTISMVFDDTPHEDEREYIEAVLRSHAFNPTFIRPAGRPLLRELSRIVRDQEGPFLAPGLALSESLYFTLAEKNCSVVLDGHGGDEVISTGLTFLFDLARNGKWVALASHSLLYGLRQAINPARPFLGLASAYGSGPLARIARRLNRSLQPSQSPDLPILAEHWREDDEAAHRKAAFGEFLPWKYPDDRAAHVALLVAPLQSYAFEVQSKLCLAHGVEGRYPLWDIRVVELCLRMAAAKKLKGGWPRALLRDAMQGVLPEKVRRRKTKLDLSGHNLRGFLLDTPMLTDIVENQSAAVSEYVDQKALRNASAQLSSKEDDTRRAAYLAVMRATTLSFWLDDRRNREHAAHAPLFVSRSPA